MQSMNIPASAAQGSMLTCQSVVDVVVSFPQPENGQRQRVHRLQIFGRHVLKMFGTSPASEEGPDVGSHGLQHLQWV